MVQSSPDAVAEFNVQTNTYSAEFGRERRRGHQRFIPQRHESIPRLCWEFHRNSSLNAMGFFKPAGGLKPPLSPNQFGFTFGGPIIRDRTFFFLDYEGFRENHEDAAIRHHRRHAEQRNGILGVAVRDPLRLRGLDGHLQRAGTMIPPVAVPMTAFARKVLAELPAPNVPAAASNNSRTCRATPFYNDKFDLKLDHKFNDKLNVFTRVSHRKAEQLRGAEHPRTRCSASERQRQPSMNQQLVGGATYDFRPTRRCSNSVWAFRAPRRARSRPLIGRAEHAAIYTALPACPMTAAVTGGLTTQTHRRIFTAARTAGQQPAIPEPDQRQPARQLLVRSRSSQLEDRLRVPAHQHRNPGHQPEDGRGPVFGSVQPRPPARHASDNLYNLADFLFGARSTYELNNTADRQYRQRMHFAYLQDDFKLNQQLTLNLGVRYEFATPQYEAQNQLSNFDPGHEVDHPGERRFVL